MLQGHARRLHGRIAVSAAARHFIDRYFPGDYKVIPNGVDVDYYRKAVPIARWQDGHANLLFVGRLEPRKGLLICSRRSGSCARPAVACRLLVVGSGPQEREARRYVMTRRLAGRRVPRPGQRRREGAAVPDRRRVRLAGHRARVVRDRPARGDGRRERRSSPRHPRLQGRRPPRRAGACSCRRATRASWPLRSRACLTTTRAAPARWAPAGSRRAETFSWERITAQGRGLLRLRHPASRRPGRPAARLPGRGSSVAAQPGAGRRAVGRRAAAHPRPGRLIVRRSATVCPGCPDQPASPAGATEPASRAAASRSAAAIRQVQAL